MSWDLYCYESASNAPDPEEAEALIHTDEASPATAWPLERQKQITQALVACNPAKSDLVVEVFVEANHVSMSVPYWYQGDEARRAFAILLTYSRALREHFGFFTYDPQAGEAFDPMTRDSLDHMLYEKTVRGLPDIIASSQPKKPWWKFW